MLGERDIFLKMGNTNYLLNTEKLKNISLKLNIF